MGHKRRRRRLRDNPRTKPSSSPSAAPQQPEEVDKVRRGIMISLAAIGLVGGAFGVKTLLSRDNKSTEEESTAIPLKPVDSTLFIRAERKPNLTREQIPQLIEGAIKPFAKVVEAPKGYDPNKPNMYLIGNLHFVKGARRGPSPETIYKIQANILQTFHKLYELGANRQFLEGVHDGMEIRHDTVYRGTESPAKALPKYKASGKIYRASRAIEGIYGNDIKTVGAEKDVAIIVAVKRAFEIANKRLFKPAFYEIFDELIKKLQITGIREINRDIIWAKVKNNPQLRKQLIEEVLLGNAKFKAYLDAHAKWAFTRIRGRNNAYAEFINSSAKHPNGDAVFIVGGTHVPHLRKKLKPYNVFVILPNGDTENLTDESLTLDRFEGFDNEKKFKQNILELDAWQFGLVEKKPTPNLFAK